MLAVVRAAATVTGGDSSDLTRVKFRRRGQIDGSEEAAHRLGGDNGAGICEASLSAERQILEMLDSLLPVNGGKGSLGTPTYTRFACSRMCRFLSMIRQSI